MEIPRSASFATLGSDRITDEVELADIRPLLFQNAFGAASRLFDNCEVTEHREVLCSLTLLVMRGRKTHLACMAACRSKLRQYLVKTILSAFAPGRY
jgi:hypothetical protein